VRKGGKFIIFQFRGDCCYGLKAKEEEERSKTISTACNQQEKNTRNGLNFTARLVNPEEAFLNGAVEKRSLTTIKNTTPENGW